MNNINGGYFFDYMLELSDSVEFFRAMLNCGLSLSLPIG